MQASSQPASVFPVPVSGSYSPHEPGQLRQPPEYQCGYEVFCSHYWYHQTRRFGLGQHPRPTLGELCMTSGLSRPTCRRHRRRLERELAKLKTEISPP